MIPVEVVEELLPDDVVCAFAAKCAPVIATTRAAILIEFFILLFFIIDLFVDDIENLNCIQVQHKQPFFYAVHFEESDI